MAKAIGQDGTQRPETSWQNVKLPINGISVNSTIRAVHGIKSCGIISVQPQ